MLFIVSSLFMPLKPYLGKKNVYEYEVLSIGIPSRFNNDVEPFLGKDFELSLKAEKSEFARALARLAQLNQSKICLFWNKFGIES